jgi:ubiquinone/menaquinone biosynthesis C-methylase UbiE
MREAEYDEMHGLESDHWWFAGMRKVTGSLLRRYAGSPERVLDVGCGTGINLTWVSRELRPAMIVGCDYSPFAIAWCGETVRAAGGDVPVRLSRGDLRALPFQTGSFDLVTILDVIDQFPPGIDHERGFSEMHRVLKPGGILYFRGPAYRWLMSSHDFVYETKHRHSASELRAAMSGAGFEIVCSTYANTILFPLALAQRLMRKYAGIDSDKTDMRPFPPGLAWLNDLFRGCLGAEAAMFSLGWRTPFGLSAICIGRKP